MRIGVGVGVSAGVRVGMGIGVGVGGVRVLRLWILGLLLARPAWPIEFDPPQLPALW